MIRGIGHDIVDIRRIEKLLEEFGERFQQRVFTPGEIALAESRTGEDRVSTYAKRFAAKEAYLKARGTGFRNIEWKDIDISNDVIGKPIMQVRTDPRRIHVSLSDDYPYASAFVIIEA